MIYPDRSHPAVNRLLSSSRSGDQAEAAVYRALEARLGHEEGWAVLWSVPVPGGAQGREIDFIVAHRSLGAAFIEVKAPPLVPSGHKWVSPVDGTAYGRDAPDYQLQQATNEFKNWLKNCATSGTPLPRIARFVALMGTKEDELKANSSALNVGCRLPSPARVTDVYQKKQAYLCCGDVIDLLPDMIVQALSDEMKNNDKSRVEESFFGMVVPQLAAQAGMRTIENDNPVSHPLDAPVVVTVARRRRTPWRLALALAVVALFLSWQAVHSLSSPSKIPLVPKKAVAVPEQKVAKPSPDKAATPSVRATDEKGRECVERRFPGTIDGMPVQLTEKLCKIDGVFRRVTD